MLPVFQVLSDYRPTVQNIFSKIPLIKDPEELKKYLDKVEMLLADYWAAEKNFTDSMSFGMLIPYRVYFSREAADKLIAKAYLAAKGGIMPIEHVNQLQSALMKERLK